MSLARRLRSTFCSTAHLHSLYSLRFLALTLPLLGGFHASAHAQVAITLQTNDSSAIPGSQRSFYANITGTTNQGVTWGVTGGCTLSSATGTPVVVTAPAAGGKCVASSTSTISFSSPVSCQITASAQDTSNGLKSVSTTLPVCAPAVALSVFPETTVVYKGQNAVLQSDLRGSINTGVTWSIKTNPGGYGTITGGLTNRHAVFSATAAGTYVVMGTSNADPTKTSTSTVYVTNNAMPTIARTDHTEPVDCTAVGSGNTYDVGPARTYTDLNAVPWNSVGAGDTVRIHNDDLTGSNPTVYHQHVSIPGTGTATEPLRICGVADAAGNKPIIDGSGSTTRSDEQWAYVEGLAVVILNDHANHLDSIFDQNQNVIVEGLHIRNANPSVNYIAQSGAASTPFSNFAACIRVQTGEQILLRGNEFDNCSQGVFTTSQTPEGSLEQDVTIEGNYVHGWGVAGVVTSHGMYLQAIGLVAQFNYFGAAVPNGPGNLLKTRSVMNFLRWNYMGEPLTASGRAFDMVEPQGYNCYVIPQDYAKQYLVAGASTDCVTPSGTDPYTPDMVAANYEAYHSDYVYGNVMDDAGSASGFVHYGYDQQTVGGPQYDRRGGTLYYWNNTHLARQTAGQKMIAETATPDQGHSYEFPTVQSVNNVYSGTTVSFIPNVSLIFPMNMDTNWMLAGYSLPFRSDTDTYMGGLTPAELATCDPYNACASSNGHMIWSRNNVVGTAASTLYTGTASPVDSTTYIPATTLQNLATALPSVIANQPSNLEYVPTTATSGFKTDSTYLGAMDRSSLGTTVVVDTPAPRAVVPAATTTSTSSSVINVSAGEAVVLKVTVSGTAGVPTGSLTMTVNGVYTGTVTLDATGSASLSPSPRLAIGTYLLAFSYSGDKTYTLASTPLTITEKIGR